MFDTNVVVSALVFGRRLSWLRALWMRGVVTPVVSHQTTTELLKVLSYPKFRLSQPDQEALLSDYLPYAEGMVLPLARPSPPIACRDHKDVVFIELAMVAAAEYLVSGDRDLTDLRKSAPVAVVTVSEFRELLERKSARSPVSP